MFPTLPYLIQKLTWDAMEHMSRAKDPTSVFEHAECQLEPGVHYVSKIGDGLIPSYRLVHEYKQIEFLTVYKMK